MLKERGPLDFVSGGRETIPDDSCFASCYVLSVEQTKLIWQKKICVHLIDM